MSLPTSDLAIFPQLTRKNTKEMSIHNLLSINVSSHYYGYYFLDIVLLLTLSSLVFIPVREAVCVKCYANILASQLKSLVGIDDIRKNEIK